MGLSCKPCGKWKSVCAKQANRLNAEKLAVKDAALGKNKKQKK